ncbi:MAG: Smr/MutS family protein [Erysipelotrichaceae bacterium]|nr:Smr/MutS family protein [Erysipelotrichaceae bacterium]MDD6093607.1 Smr/MutS family protein [bacterium]MDY3934693.1 Smr/MutS family protein [Bacilli bacterium]
MDDILINSYPSIDMHGYDRDSARVTTQDFVTWNVALGNETVVIIHGIGQGIVREAVHEELKHNKNVLKYWVDVFNPGVTVVKIKISLE